MRTSARSALLALLMLFCLATPLFSQSAAKEPVAKAARGSISGRITIKDKPARGVAVGIRPNGLMGGGDSFMKGITDAEGVYRLTDVPPGNFLVRVAAPALISADLTDFKTVVVGEGENVEGINFSLLRGGVITGRVTDSEGHPLILQNVAIIPVEPMDGQKSPREVRDPSVGQTDDRGMYRVYGLRPGRYKVAAGQGGQLVGGIFSSRTRYKQTFHPDVIDPAKATIIEVTEGSEATKIDITLGSVTQAYAVSGRMVNGESGAPVANQGFSLRSLAGGRVAFAQTDARGEFVMEGVAPAKYGVMIVGEGSGLRADKVTVEVIDRDLEDVTIRLSTGLSVSGVVILETEDKAARSKLPELMIGATVHPDSEMRFGSSASSPVAVDGSFTLRGLTKGTLNLWLGGASSNPAKGLAISRIERDGVSVPRIQIQEGQNVTGVKLFVAYGSAGLRGVVNVENGTLSPGARVFVRISRQGESVSFVRNAAADERGRFVFEGILSGLYEITTNVTGAAKTPKPVKQQINVIDGVVAEVKLAIDLSAVDTP